MYLKRKKETELTGIENYLRGLMIKQSIAYFPVGRALCLPTDKKEVRPSLRENGSRRVMRSH
jgi:hypothetical protein